MNIALEEISKKEIRADYLPFLEEVEKMKFICSDSRCGIPVVPSSFKEYNIQAPHFRKLVGYTHHEDCDYAKNNTIYGKGKSGLKITDKEAKKIGFPNKFNILEEDITKEKKDVYNHNVGKNVDSKNKRRHTEISSDFSDHKLNQVSSIEKIVDCYLSFPANRDQRIKINNIPLDYDTLFKEILANKKHIGIQKQFFFSKVKVATDKSRNSSFKDFRETVYIKLFPADFPDDGKPFKQYELILDKNKISNKKLSMVKISFDKMLFEPKKGYDLYVFFIGDAPKDSEGASFNLINGYICFRYTDIRDSI
ncbi:hypothetical protein [Myroides odoratimimus]|uniref:hypothetical protein n=1 Tax=Myroides odoratimimus TaxID=76832 RepID=UPI0031010275